MNDLFDIIKVQISSNLTKKQKEALKRFRILEPIFRVQLYGVKDNPWFYLGLIDNSSPSRCPCYRCKYDLESQEIKSIDGNSYGTCGGFCERVFNGLLKYLEDRNHPITETQQFKEGNLTMIFLDDDFSLEDLDVKTLDLTKPIISLSEIEKLVCSTYCPQEEINLCEKCWEKADFCVIKKLMERKNG